MKFTAEFYYNGKLTKDSFAVDSETSFFRIQQMVRNQYPDANNIKILEDDWKLLSKPPDNTARAVAVVNRDFTCRTFLPGWKFSDIMIFATKKSFWCYTELPTLPAEMEGDC